MRAIGIVLALALAGCAGEAYDWRSGRGRRGRAAGGGDARRLGGGGAAGARTAAGLAVRAFVPGSGPGGWDEVPGARCRVEGAPYFGATVVTPVRLTLPDLGPDAPVLRAECEQGTLRGARGGGAGLQLAGGGPALGAGSGSGGAAAGGGASRRPGRCATPTSRSRCTEAPADAARRLLTLAVLALAACCGAAGGGAAAGRGAGSIPTRRRSCAR